MATGCRTKRRLLAFHKPLARPVRRTARVVKRLIPPDGRAQPRDAGARRPPYRPSNTGSRFSVNALTPSAKSFDPKSGSNCR